MKKIFAIFGICMVILLATGVIAETISDTNIGFSTDIEDMIKEIAETKGIAKEEIKEIKKVDFNNLPDEVKIENIDETNIAMYQIDSGDNKPIYIITVSDEKFEQTIEKVFSHRMLLNYGSSNEISETQFLESATGVKGSLEKGYVMIRDGSITGLSTNLEILEIVENSEVEIIVYKNKEKVGFRKSFITSGIKSDFDIQSEEIVMFEAGDIISIEININGQAIVKDITTLIEIAVE